MLLAKPAIAFALILSAQISAPRKPAKSARVGDLLVSAIHVRVPQDPSYKGLAYPDRDHVVVVEVTVKNISERMSQANFLPQLKVKPYAEYPWYAWTRVPSGVAKPPDLYQLLPGEERTGAYVFEVRNGTIPVALVLEFRGQKSNIELEGTLENQPPK